MQCAKVIVCNNNHVLVDYSCMLVTSHFLMHNILLLFNQIDRSIFLNVLFVLYLIWLLLT